MKYLWNILIAIDQLANVLFGPLFNWALKTPEGARFGHPDETISGVMGKNIRAGHCKVCRAVCWILDRVDPRSDDHCGSAIEDDRPLT